MRRVRDCDLRDQFQRRENDLVISLVRANDWLAQRKKYNSCKLLSLNIDTIYNDTLLTKYQHGKNTMTATFNPVAKPQQLLLRLPEDLSQRFAQIVPQRQRSRFLLDLLRAELDRESQTLALAAKTLTELESTDFKTLSETKQWESAILTTGSADEDANFDAETFEREFAAAQAKR